MSKETFQERVMASIDNEVLIEKEDSEMSDQEYNTYKIRNVDKKAEEERESEFRHKKAEKELNRKKLQDALINDQLRPEDEQLVDFPVVNQKTKAKKPAIPKIAADDDSIDFGVTNLYGDVQKQRGSTKNFHPRWLVLKGLDLYWYRTSESTSPKGVIRLGNNPITEEKVEKLKCFKLFNEKERDLCFLDQDNGRTFHIKLEHILSLRRYIEFCQEKGIEFDFHIISFLENTDSECLQLDSFNMVAEIVMYLLANFHIRYLPFP